MRITHCVILTLLFNLSFGQVFKNDSIINTFTNNLTKKGVDTILIYEAAYVGGLGPIVLLENDSCSFAVGEPQYSYIFWKENNQDYISKFVTYDCYNYEAITYDSDDIWDFYYNNKARLKTEKILAPSYVEEGDTLEVDVDHYSYSQIRFMDRQSIFEYEVNEFYFQDSISDRVNLNYMRNMKTMRRKLQNIIDEQILYIEDKQLIKKK